MPRSRTPPEALDALRERLRATQEAAQKLADEAAASSSGPPPAGWDVPGRVDDANAEIDALVRMLSMLRELVPPDLRAQLSELVRQLLLFVRAVLDWWIERTAEGPRGDEPPVEDIPIT